MPVWVCPKRCFVLLDLLPKRANFNTMHTVITWCRNQPVWFAIILFVLTIPLSLYAAELKHFLHSWPRTKKTLRRFSYNRAQSKLKLLKALHQDSYRLNLYVYGSLLYVFRFSVYLYTGVILVSLIFTRHFPTWLSLWGTASGILMGRLLDLSDVFKDLEKYERAVTRLEREIARFAEDDEAKKVTTGA